MLNPIYIHVHLFLKCYTTICQLCLQNYHIPIQMCGLEKVICYVHVYSIVPHQHIEINLSQF